MLLGLISISTIFAFAPISQQWGYVNVLDLFLVSILISGILLIQSASIILLEAIGRGGKKIKFSTKTLAIIYLNLNIFYFYFVLTNSEKYYFLIIAVPMSIALLISYYSVTVKKLVPLICLLILIQQLLTPALTSSMENSSDMATSFNKPASVKPVHSIYFIVLDALVSQEALSKLYRASDLPHVKFMDENHYQIYNILTPGFDTSSTFGSWYSYGSVKNLRSPKRYFNGISSNPLYSDLRNNNFKIQFISHSDYLGVDVGKIDSFYPQSASVAICDIGSIRYSFGICGYDFFKKFLNLLRADIVLGRRLGNELGYSYVEDRLRFSNSAQSDKWFSVSYILYPGHADYYAPNDYDSIEEYRRQYIMRLPALSRHLDSLHRKILTNDPEAVIIFVGDHGGYLTGRWTPAEGDNTYNQQLFDLDRRSVLMAVYPSTFCKNDLEKNLRNSEKLMKTLISCAI